MFFSGDSSARKRVDLGGRSSKERDRQMVLEEARLERKRRLEARQRNSAALKIQKCFRGWKAGWMARSEVRIEFVNVYGGCYSRVDRSCFSPDSEFLRQLLFFFNAANCDDVNVLVGVCQRLLELVSTDIVDMFSGRDYDSNYAIVNYRVKRLAYNCLEAVHRNRDLLKNKMLVDDNSSWEGSLMDTVVMLINASLPWACNVVDFLTHRRVFSLLKDIIVSGLMSGGGSEYPGQVSPLERVIILLASHTGEDRCLCKDEDTTWKFASEILSVPFLWKHFLCLKEVFTTELWGKHQIRQIAAAFSNDAVCLPTNASNEYPSNICLLGNLLETAAVMLAQPSCTHDLAVNFVVVISHLMAMMPSSNEANNENRDSEATDIDKEVLVEKRTLNVNVDLKKQIFNAMNPSFLERLVKSLFVDSSQIDYSLCGGQELSAIRAICYFLYVAFASLPAERLVTTLCYRTDMVPILWKFIKWCHETRQCPSFSFPTINWPQDVPGWFLPLAVFCPVYKHMLTVLDNEEFYDEGKPLPLNENRSLVIILREVLWALLWLTPAASGLPKSVSTSQRTSINSDILKSKARAAISELLNKLQDWNNRRPFVHASDFHAPEAIGDNFLSQASTPKAHEILKHAPFLVPFTSRVKIFTSLLATARQSYRHHPAFVRHKVTIRRGHMFEDAFTKLSSLSDEELRGKIQISFINEVGAEEAGVDGGGIFKDFLENVIRETFSVQYGLFKETSNHLLYPNPASGLVHEQHLQYFRFLGTLLGKAMFEGILVDIPFATFFLSKLKHKQNYINDLPSLDPELYRHLLFLKNYKGDVSELELYFVVVDDDYGEQKEVELLEGGKNKHVTKDNVIPFIHYVAHHRLNSQIRIQSSHFLRGFEQLINPEWINMFSEQEIQNLISGSSDGMDVEDLCVNAIYSGGYHEDHVVIKMFWDVVKSFSSEHQKKFLKFVTGCSRGPLLGFKYLEPKFCIQRAASLDATDEDLDRLPTSATCINLLKLPPYRSLEQLRDKLAYAISAEAGFDLS